MELIDGQFNLSGLSNITMVNRGINGGFVSDLLNGVPSANISNFTQALAQDQPTIVSIFIGTNDVWFPTSPRHSDPGPFVATLTQLVNMAKKAGASVLLSTLAYVALVDLMCDRRC